MRKAKTIKTIIYTISGIFLGCIFLFPIGILILNSFKNIKGIFTNVIGIPNAETFTMDNYRNAFFAMDYGRSLLNSLLITVISSLLLLLVSAMAAWVLVRYKTKVSKIIFFIFAASMLIPFQCVMLSLVFFANSIHMMNPLGLVFMYVGFGASMSIVMLHSFIKNIPEEVEEAAIIDGCNTVQLFFMIVVPLIRGSLITVEVLNVMWIWNDFMLPSLIINRPGWQTLPLKTYLFFGQYLRRWDLACAALFMCTVPILIFYLFSQKYIVKGITDGAIK